MKANRGEILKDREDIEWMDRYVDSIIIGTCAQYGRLSGTDVFDMAIQLVKERKEIMESLKIPKK